MALEYIDLLEVALCLTNPPHHHYLPHPHYPPTGHGDGMRQLDALRVKSMNTI